jgi:hypothetical protein
VAILSQWEFVVDENIPRNIPREGEGGVSQGSSAESPNIFGYLPVLMI